MYDGKTLFSAVDNFFLYQGTSRATCVQFAKEEGILLDFAVHSAHSTKNNILTKKMCFYCFFPSKRKKGYIYIVRVFPVPGNSQMFPAKPPNIGGK